VKPRGMQTSAGGVVPEIEGMGGFGQVCAASTATAPRIGNQRMSFFR